MEPKRPPSTPTPTTRIQPRPLFPAPVQAPGQAAANGTAPAEAHNRGVSVVLVLSVRTPEVQPVEREGGDSQILQVVDVSSVRSRG